ncbi:hypothetical protein [Thalassospira alkalitolerans]|uniref:hypothetical protein n=1 Tax=Thalassospira alkalitolerans TaxID=1293890 RepID=UPI003AA97030
MVGVLSAIVISLIICTPAQARYAPKKVDFFDLDRAVGFWSELKTRDDLEKAYAQCDSSEAYNHWDARWLNDGSTKIEDLQLEDEADRQLVEYCHDLNRTYDYWARWYDSIEKMMTTTTALNPNGPIAEPWNEWKVLCERYDYWNEKYRDRGYNDDHKNIFTGECNDLPDWRLPDQVKKYDTLLANSVIRSGKNNEQSRMVVSNYLAKHGDTLSKADRKALEEIIKQFQ